MLCIGIRNVYMLEIGQDKTEFSRVSVLSRHAAFCLIPLILRKALVPLQHLVLDTVQSEHSDSLLDVISVHQQSIQLCPQEEMDLSHLLSENISTPAILFINNPATC